jgi:hypothetical protein
MKFASPYFLILVPTTLSFSLRNVALRKLLIILCGMTRVEDERAKEKKHIETRCPKFVQDAADIIELVSE